MATILIVEDDEILRYSMERHLVTQGLTVISVADSMAALKVLDSPRDDPIDVLLTDIVMPEGNPHGLALALMARRRVPTLQIIYITGYRDVVEALGAPLDAPMFSKPLDLDAVAAEIQRLTAN